VVYGREFNGETITFGTTGYTMNNIFVLYDRATESIWYPTSDEFLESTSGARRGKRIPFLQKPIPLPLAEWRIQNPETKVLLPR
jgi:hypothetical protein